MEEATKNRVILGFGSDLGDRLGHLERAVVKLKNIGSVIQRSSIYESEAMGFLSKHLFLNMAVQIESNLSVSELFIACQEIEQDQLRIKRSEGYEDRTLDIDILFFNDEVICESDLVVPHIGVQKRAFVLAPLLEILPDMIHPIEKKTISELYLNCDGLKELRLYHP